MAFEEWKDLPRLAVNVNEDHLFVVVTARKGTVSYSPSFESLPEQLSRFYNSNSLMIVFPDQYGAPQDVLTFSALQQPKEQTAFSYLHDWYQKKIKHQI